MAEGDFEAVNAVDGGVACWGAAQSLDYGIGDKTHVHQVVLDVFRQVEGDEDTAFTHF